MIVPIFLPILVGIMLIAARKLTVRVRNLITVIISLINLIIVFAAVRQENTEVFKLLELTEDIALTFRIDGFGRFFAMLVSSLWPFSVLYAFEYMENEERQDKFFGFFTMTLGSVIGIAFAGDLLTLYIFYELLTLFTFPLVMHTMTDEAMKAGKSYLVYMLGGAAFAFVGILVVMNSSSSLIFNLGGNMLTSGTVSQGMLIFVFFMMFCGFSVKAAMMPFGRWLIRAAVAPMPVTGLLHAVAVVKAGVFAVIRLIYYVFGTEFLKGTWAQYAGIILVTATILYGSVMAVKEPHLKRKMAYSTISNLSYILFGALLMTPSGMTASMTHLAAHAIAKIGLFFSVGAIMHVTGKCYIYEIDGLGRRMKGIFACFTLVSLSLIGIPQFIGFISKIRLLTAAAEAGGFFAYMGAFAIVISALLTAVYLLTIVIRAYYPKDNVLCVNWEQAHDPGWKMMVTIGASTLASLLLGIFWEPLLNVLKSVSGII